MLALLGAALMASPAFAHHPFSSEFDANAPVHLTGKVARVDWTNPHVTIHITEAAGNRNWTLEAAGPGDLTRKGCSRDSVKVGDQITVCP
jgi:hypothetical protein